MRMSCASRSEYCRNVKLKYCLMSDAPWAKAFREKLAKQPSEGGFTGKLNCSLNDISLVDKTSRLPAISTSRPKQGRSRRSGLSGHGLTTLSATNFFYYSSLRGEIFSLKFTKYRSAAGLRPDPLGELKRSPKPP